MAGMAACALQAGKAGGCPQAGRCRCKHRGQRTAPNMQAGSDGRAVQARQRSCSGQQGALECIPEAAPCSLASGLVQAQAGRRCHGEHSGPQCTDRVSARHACKALVMLTAAESLPVPRVMLTHASEQSPATLTATAGRTADLSMCPRYAHSKLQGPCGLRCGKAAACHC